MKNQIPVLLLLFFLQQLNSQDLVEEEIILRDMGNGTSIDIKVPAEKKDLSAFMGISACIANTGDDEFRIEGQINNQAWVNSCVYPQPGQVRTMQIILQRRKTEAEINEFPGMRGLPGGTVSFGNVDPSSISKITFKIYTKGKASLRIYDIRPYGKFTPAGEMALKNGFFPFIDSLGQYKHSGWPGKTKNASQMRESLVIENKDLEIFRGPSDRNRFGGWSAGPAMKATGSFRTDKVDGKWWLVDPEGRLFWSHALTGIRFNNSDTRVSGREKFFEYLPGKESDEGKFYSVKAGDTNYCFGMVNLYRKYGPEWKDKATVHALRRMRSWGINSFGNWSDQNIFLYPENRMPYTVAISPAWPKADGNDAKFPDVFDPSFRESLQTSLKNLDSRILNDSFCIGFFIDNELTVKDITREIMSQPAGSKSRQPFIDLLRKKYSSVSDLNAKWGTKYNSWAQVSKLNVLPTGADADIRSFDLEMIDIYYRTCVEELKKVAPDKLYFGSRLHCHYYPDDQSETDIIAIAAKYCDVVCFNRYRFSAEDLILPGGIDKPVIIGEFHFGALDRGLCHTGLRNVASQEQRAEAYYKYVEGALNNPQMVGTHWFQYSDQSYTGRGDGENYQIGFVDICDNPYPEIVQAARKAGYSMYRLRYSGR